MSKFWWRAHPARAIAEAWTLGLLLVLGYSCLIGRVSPVAFNNGLMLLCGLCGMWAVLRARLPQGSVLRQGSQELATGIGLSLAMWALRLPARLTGLEAVWDHSSWSAAGITLLLECTGVGYMGARVVLRLWLFWDRLRHRRMRWALTHALLMVVVLAAILGALGIFLLSPYSQSAAEARARVADPFASTITDLLLFVFPASGVIIVLTVIALAVILPPSALFSFLVARQTTRRLEKLAAAAKALRAGDYEARVAVAGEDEVAQLQSAFNEMADTLGRTLRALQDERDMVAHLLQARRELIANVSHELRTPVATVRATLDTALERWDGAPPPALRHDLEVMEGEITRLQGLIDDLFALARAEAGQLALQRCPTDIGPIVQRMVEAMAPLAWRSGRVEVVADIPAELPCVRVDAERTEQILANLLRNGVRHTPPGGIVAVQLTPEGTHLRIAVRDTGEGIAPEDLAHIWERFYRGSNSRASDGAGLGLALVRELAVAMEGTVAVESTPGQGSCFTVRLPRA